MRRIVPLLTLIAMCVLAPCVHAWSDLPDDDAGRLAAFLPLARAAWPGSPCAGREVVHLEADAALAAAAPDVTGHGDGTVSGLAAPTTCEVWVSADLSALGFCTVLVHELGHLAGHEHTDIPGDVMNGAGDIKYEPCERAVTPPPHVMLEEEMRSMLPGPRRSWRVTCGPWRGSKRRCVARRGSSVRRYDVRLTPDSVSIARTR